MVCGSIGYGGIDDIKNMYTLLVSRGFSVVDHILHKGMDYSHITDFRDKQDLSSEIVKHDLKYIESSDIVIANGPSHIVLFYAIIIKKKLKKKERLHGSQAVVNEIIYARNSGQRFYSNP
jgi:hypothetical protein